MNTIAARVVAVLISIFLLAYVGYQAYLAAYDPYDSQVVTFGKYNLEVKLEGFFLRDEVLASSANANKTIGYDCENGEKIAKDAIIAQSYVKETDLYNIKAIEELNKLRETIELSQEDGAIKGVKLDVLTQTIDKLEVELIKTVANKNFNALNQTYYDLLFNMNKYRVCINNEVNYDATVASIDSLIKDLEKQTNTNTQAIKSPSSGYFSNVVDGYEGVFNADYLANISVNGVKQSLAQNELSPKTNYIGKVLKDSEWRFVSLVDVKEIDKFKKGRTVNLQFDSKTTKTVPSVVESITTQDGEDKAVIVFVADYMDEAFSTIRFEKPTALITSYEGVVIPKDAIRFDKDGNPGVYTLLGKNIRFKQVDLVYEDKFIYISRANDNSNFVTNYDEVIIKGKDLDAKSGKN